MGAFNLTHQQGLPFKTSIKSFLRFSKSDGRNHSPFMRTTYARCARPRKMGCLDAYPQSIPPNFLINRPPLLDDELRWILVKMY